MRVSISVDHTYTTNFPFTSKPKNSHPSVGNRVWVLFTFCLFVLLARSLAQAASLPSGFTETLIASGIASPTAMAFAPDGRLFVCEQGGKLRVIKNGTLLATPFLT